jgi:hypothetical protein
MQPVRIAGASTSEAPMFITYLPRETYFFSTGLLRFLQNDNIGRFLEDA